MHKLKTTALMVSSVLATAAVAASAHSFKVGSIDIGHPNARPTRAGQSVGAGYLTLVNRGAFDRLVSARTEVAASVEMHSMSMDGDVMRMRQVEAIDLPSGQTVALQPGGYHLMLMGLKRPLVVGSKFPLTLTFEKAGAVVVKMNVEDVKRGAASATPVTSGASQPASTAGPAHLHIP